jgi:hypothetical protein
MAQAETNTTTSRRALLAAGAMAGERGQVTVRLDGPTRARLEREAAQDRRPVASLARADRERAIGRTAHADEF